MARKPRIHFPGALYHVMLRAYVAEKVFLHNRDRQTFLWLVQDGVERFRHEVHAYCLLPASIHLLVRVREIALSRVMQNLSFRYTRYLNERHGRQGHLFHGRYKALIVDPDSYLLELVRYLHLLPVEEGFVRKPEDFRWSSHRAYLGLEEVPWLTTEWVLSRFSPKLGWARRKFQTYVLQEKGTGYRPDFHSGTSEGRFLGDGGFAQEAFRQAGKVKSSRVTLDGVIQRVCRLYRMDERELLAPGKARGPAEARGVVALIVREAPHLSLTDLSAHFGRDITTLSTAASRLVARAKKDPELAARLQRLKVSY